MAIFKKGPEAFGRLDWELLQNGPVSLYFQRTVLEEDLQWLRTNAYVIDGFDCSHWQTEEHMHSDLAATLVFPDYYGKNLDALNDCLSDMEIPETGGRVLVFQNFDRFGQKFEKVAGTVLDIIAEKSRHFLLFGERLICLVQSNDPRISFERLGGTPANWNRKEWLNKNRGL